MPAPFRRCAATLAAAGVRSTGKALAAAAALLLAAGVAEAQMLPGGKTPGGAPPQIAPPAASGQPACGDWGELGYGDGFRGLRNAYFARARSCAGGGAVADLLRYQAGYEEGLAAYCAPENGYRIGALDLAYEGVCPAHLEPAFLAEYRRGLARGEADDGRRDDLWKGVLIPHHLKRDRRKGPPGFPKRPRDRDRRDREPPAVRAPPGSETAPPEYRRPRDPPAARAAPEAEAGSSASPGRRAPRAKDGRESRGDGAPRRRRDADRAHGQPPRDAPRSDPTREDDWRRGGASQ